MKTTLIVLGFLVVPLSAAAKGPEAPSSAPAPEVSTAAPPPGRPDRGAVLLGAKLGGLFPFLGLDPFVSAGVEAGYVLPYFRRSFAVYLEVAYTQPTASGTVAGDPRVADSQYTWHLTQRELVFAPVLSYRFTRLGRLVPHAGVGPRIYLLESVVSGRAGGQPMSSTTEHSTKVGVGVPLGVDFKLGPGALTGEFLLEWGPINHQATGHSTSTTGGSLRVGYRLLF